MTQIPLPICDPSTSRVLASMARGADELAEIARGADLPVARVVEILRGLSGVVAPRGRRWVRV